MVRFLVLFQEVGLAEGSVLTPHPLAIHPRLAGYCVHHPGSSARTAAHKCHGSGLCAGAAAGVTAGSITTKSASLPGWKLPIFLLQPQGARPAEGGVIEGLAGAQAIALQLSYLVGLAQRPQHAEGGPGSDVAADAHPHLVAASRRAGGTARCRETDSTSGRRRLRTRCHAGTATRHHRDGSRERRRCVRR